MNLVREKNIIALSSEINNLISSNQDDIQLLLEGDFEELGILVNYLQNSGLEAEEKKELAQEIISYSQPYLKTQDILLPTKSENNHINDQIASLINDRAKENEYIFRIVKGEKTAETIVIELFDDFIKKGVNQVIIEKYSKINEIILIETPDLINEEYGSIFVKKNKGYDPQDPLFQINGRYKVQTPHKVLNKVLTQNRFGRKIAPETMKEGLKAQTELVLGMNSAVNEANQLDQNLRKFYFNKEE